MQKILLIFSLLSFGVSSCNKSRQADLIVHNALVYSADSTFQLHQAFAVIDGKFAEVGSSADILAKYEADSVLDAGGKPVYPGFIDPHSHFFVLAKMLDEADLTGTTSFDEIIDRLKKFRGEHPNKTWLIGRGWDQNDWDNKIFPSRELLDKEFPDIPVFLARIDGHAAVANSKALSLAGVQRTSTVEGGWVELKNGQPTGILIDNAQSLVRKIIPENSTSEIQHLLQEAEKMCFSVGLTSVSDAGLNRLDIELLEKMYQNGSLKIRDYAMIAASQANLDYYLPKGPSMTDRLTVSSFKIVADGALGSRGACLLQPYSDAATSGFLLSNPKQLEDNISRIARSDFQANTHCIGDSANRLILDLYVKYLKGKNDRRWRIEHAQVVTFGDVPKFGAFSIIPSVQPTHATSDMYWAEARLGKDRVKTAYAFKDLLRQNGKIAFGSDFPVEHFNPIYGFHAAVSRKDAKGYPQTGYQIENAVSREQALKGMTIWAAHANFEDTNRGSIEPGKWADFVILEKDIMKAPENELRDIKTLRTVLGGTTVFKR
jgi:predicted amidohydrolase YtcJ